MTSHTASSLIDGLRLKQAEAWQRLSQLYGPLVYRWCTQAGLQHHDASDVTQEVFRSVWLGIERFHNDRSGDSFGGWLRTITRNKIRDLARKRQNHPDAIGGSTIQQRMSNLAAADSDSSAPAVPFDNRGLYNRALEQIRAEFEDRTWQAFYSVVVHQHYPADVAERLEMTINAVYKAKARVLKRLREELGEAM